MKLISDQNRTPIKIAEAISSLHHSPNGEKIATRTAAKINTSFIIERLTDFHNRLRNISRKIGFPVFREKLRKFESAEPAKSKKDIQKSLSRTTHQNHHIQWNRNHYTQCNPEYRIQNCHPNLLNHQC